MSKVGKWESGKVPVLLSHRNDNKFILILHFIRFLLSLTSSSYSHSKIKDKIRLKNVVKESRCKGTAKIRNVQYLKDRIYQSWGSLRSKL